MCNLQKWNSLTLPSIMVFFRVDFCLFKPLCQSYCLTSRGLQQCKLWDFEGYYVGERPLLGMSENYSSFSEKRWSLIKNDQCWAAAIFPSALPPWPRKDSSIALYFWMSFQRMWHVSSSEAVECSIYTIWLLPYTVWVCVRRMLNLVYNGWQVPSKLGACQSQLWACGLILCLPSLHPTVSFVCTGNNLDADNFMCSNSGTSVVFDYHWKLLCMANVGSQGWSVSW